MLWCWWGAVVAWDKFEYRTKFFVDAIPMGERFSMLKRNPSACNKSKNCHDIVSGLCALIFPITALNLLMQLFLHLPLQDSSPRWLVKACSLQNMRRINPIIMATTHNMFLEIGSELVFVDGYLTPSVVCARTLGAAELSETGDQSKKLTLLYVAL